MFSIRFIWNKLKGGRIRLFIGLFLTVFIALLVIINPYLTGILVDDVVLGTGGEVNVTLLGVLAFTGTRRQALFAVLGMMLGIILISCIIKFLRVMMMEQSSQVMLMNVRKTLFHRIQTEDMGFFRKIRSGDIITRATGDLEYLRHFCAWVDYQIVEMLTMLVAAIVVLSRVSWKLMLALSAVMPFLFGAALLYSRYIRPLYRKIRESLSRLNVQAQENISGNRVVKAFAREEREKAKFAEASKQYLAVNYRANKIWQKFVPFIDFLAHSLTFITLLFGGILVIRGDMTLGDLTMFTSMTWVLTTPMSSLPGLLNDIQRFTSSADKVVALTEEAPLIADRHDAIPFHGRMRGKIEFRDVSFSYGGKPILNHVSFTVTPGETIAVMGPTGCGKTTLVNLLARFIEPQDGAVLLDDIDTHMRTLASIHAAIGIATQDVFLFSDTVAGNIAFCNPEMEQDSIERYAAYAAADGFIRKMSEGYETVVGERGVGLSGGQRQRISLARALAAEPAVLVLDDTTSAVDMETEQYIQQSLKNLPFSCTKLIIAQRISSVRDADRIFVMEDGQITIGTHETLVRTNRYYRDVCELQDVADLPAFETEVSR